MVPRHTASPANLRSSQQLRAANGQVGGPNLLGVRCEGTSPGSAPVTHPRDAAGVRFAAPSLGDVLLDEDVRGQGAVPLVGEVNGHSVRLRGHDVPRAPLTVMQNVAGPETTVPAAAPAMGRGTRANCHRATPIR